MKKILGLVLTIVMMFGILSFGALAASESDVFEWVVEPTYDYLGPVGYQYNHGAGIIIPFAEGGHWAVAEGENIYVGGKYGYINFDGIVREPVYDWAGAYNYGYARVKAGEYYGYIFEDRYDYLIKPQFKQAGDFERYNLRYCAWVESDSIGDDGTKYFIRNPGYYTEDGGFAFWPDFWEIVPMSMEERGYTLLRTDEGIEFFEKTYPFLDGAARIERIYNNNGPAEYVEYSFVGINGEKIGNEAYRVASDFNRGVAVVGITDNNGNISYGLIDNTGTVIYGFQDDFEFIGGFVDGYCTVRHAPTGKSGVVKLSPPRIVAVNSLGTFLKFDQPPIIENGRVLVPVRAIFNSIWMAVDWNDDTQTVTATSDYVEIRLTVNDTTAYVNNVAVTMDVPPRIVSGRVLVPVRFISEAAGRPVEWDAENMTVMIYSGNKPVG